MTSTLRRRHRRVVTALAVLLPAGVAVALLARPAPLPAARLGIVALDTPPATPAAQLWEGRADDGTLAIRARLVRLAPAAETGTVALDVDVRSAVGQPATLAYWSRAARADAPLPDDAVLLGPVSFQDTQRMALPASVRDRAGALVLYRIAQGSVVATLPLPAADAARSAGAAS